MPPKTKALTPVLVTTEHRGVFFGYLGGEAPSKEKVTIQDARNCLSWDASVKGFLGLASTGPNGQCRVGPKAPKMTLHDITAVVECTPEAAAAWEAAIQPNRKDPDPVVIGNDCHVRYPLIVDYHEAPDWETEVIVSPVDEPRRRRTAR